MRPNEILEPEAGPGLRGWLAWGAAALFFLYEFFARVAPSVMERSMQEALHQDAASMGTALGAYFYIYAPLQLVVGGIIDRLGPRQVLIPAVLAVALGCLLESLAPDVGMVALARILQGAGSAFAFVGTIYVAATYFPHRQLALLAGLTTALGMAGGIIGNAGIADISETLGWRTTLQLAAGLGVVLAVFLALVLSGRKEAASPSDASEEPLPFLHAFKAVILGKQTWIIGLISACLYAPLPVLGDLWGDRYVETMTGVSTSTAARVGSFLFLGWLVGAPLAGWISDHAQRRKVILVISCALTALLGSVLVLATALTVWTAGALFFFLGIVSSAQVITFVASVEVNPRLCKGMAISVTNMIVMVIGGSLQPIVGWILDHMAGAGVTDYSANDFRVAMAVLPGLALVGLCLSFFLKESCNTIIEGEETFEER